MDRRNTVLALLALGVGPFTARAQRSSVPAIGFLGGTAAGENTNFVTAFRRGLSDSGYVEGQNVTIEYRWAEGQYDRLPALAAELVRRQVAVIAAIGGTPPVLAAKEATAKIPIVFITGDDPVKLGLVANLSRPGGNLTGVSLISVALQPKRLELLRELVPKATSVAMLVNPRNPQSEFQAQSLSAAARSIGLPLHILKASSDHDFEGTYTTLVRLRVSALVVAPDGFFTSRRAKLVALAARHALPTMYPWAEFVAAGGLVSYGTSLTDAYRLQGVYVSRILKGAKPAARLRAVLH